MYNKFIQSKPYSDTGKLKHLSGTDLEHCFFINHDETGGCCAVYRSLEKKLIVVSFRGTCAPKDLITDVTITQDAWVEGEDVNDPDTPKVHAGFRYVYGPSLQKCVSLFVVLTVHLFLKIISQLDLEAPQRVDFSHPGAC
jgi:hypothetical protein